MKQRGLRKNNQAKLDSFEQWHQKKNIHMDLDISGRIKILRIFVSI